MKYKLIASDLDGTLFDTNCNISPENQAAIEAARANGVHFVICTGRSFISVVESVKLLNLMNDDCYIIAYNGAIVYKTKTHEILYEVNLGHEYVKYIIDKAKQYDVEIQIYIGDELYVENLNPRVVAYSATKIMKANVVGDLNQFIKGDVSKIILNGQPDVLKQIFNDNAEWCEGKVSTFFSQPDLLEYVNINVSKGSGLAFLADYLGLKAEEVIAVGDYYNDLEMIKYAGVGVAVANAMPEVKECANYVTQSTHNQSAIKEVIDKFILEA